MYVCRVILLKFCFMFTVEMCVSWMVTWLRVFRSPMCHVTSHRPITIAFATRTFFILETERETFKTKCHSKLTRMP
jgi:hypothetical protein